MRLGKPAVLKLEGVDESLFSGLRDLCIGHDMLRSESYVSPSLRILLGPFYSLWRYLSRTFGVGLADVTSMHSHYGNALFMRLAATAQKAAEQALSSELTLVTALTHKAKYGEFSSWHNGYYSPYIYNDDAPVLSVWVPLQSVSPETGSCFRFWHAESIEAKARQLCSERWKELDAKPHAGPMDIVSPGKALRALYKLARDSDRESDNDRCTCHAQLGEAILFNEYWPHTTTKWVGKGVRLSIVLRFVKKGTGLNKARLQRRRQALRLGDAEWAQYCAHISRIED